MEKYKHSKNPKPNLDKNVTKHQPELKDGEFVLFSNNILKIQNLSSTSKLILCLVMSDKDNFNFLPQNIMNRLGIKRLKFYKCLDELEEKGFLRRTKISNFSNTNYYTFSTYGNLKQKEEIVEEVKKEPSIKDIEILFDKDLDRCLNTYGEKFNKLTKKDKTEFIIRIFEYCKNKKEWSEQEFGGRFLQYLTSFSKNNNPEINHEYND